jgi:hypothetical protein
MPEWLIRTHAMHYAALWDRYCSDINADERNMLVVELVAMRGEVDMEIFSTRVWNILVEPWGRRPTQP